MSKFTPKLFPGSDEMVKKYLHPFFTNYVSIMEISRNGSHIEYALLFHHETRYELSQIVLLKGQMQKIEEALQVFKDDKNFLNFPSVQDLVNQLSRTVTFPQKDTD